MLGVQALQRVDSDAAALQGGDAFGGSASGGHGSDGGNARENRGATNGLLVEVRILTTRRIDDELDAIAFDEVDDIRAAFFHLIDAINGHASFLDGVGRAFRSDQVKT